LDAYCSWVAVDDKKQEKPPAIEHKGETTVSSSAFQNPVIRTQMSEDELVTMDVEAPHGQVVSNVSGFWQSQSNLGLCQGRDSHQRTHTLSEGELPAVATAESMYPHQHGGSFAEPGLQQRGIPSDAAVLVPVALSLDDDQLSVKGNAEVQRFMPWEGVPTKQLSYKVERYGRNLYVLGYLAFLGTAYFRVLT